MKVIDRIRLALRALFGPETKDFMRIRVQVRNHTFLVKVEPKHIVRGPMDKGEKIVLQFSQDKRDRLHYQIEKTIDKFTKAEGEGDPEFPPEEIFAKDGGYKEGIEVRKAPDDILAEALRGTPLEGMHEKPKPKPRETPEERRKRREELRRKQ